MENARQIAESLFSRTTQGIKLGLERMRAAASRCGNPQDGYASIHVAGTNGKGSTCAYIESVLRHQGYRTGLFTSPHIVSFEERFLIDGKPVTSDQWVEVYLEMKPVIEEFELTFFEATTLLAFELFKREKIDCAVFETGMGGRLDSTNIIRPAVCAITRIAMDHMTFLGNDLLSIAGEKLGIVKKGIPLVMAEPDSLEIRKFALSLCMHQGVKCLFADTREANDIKTADNGVTFTYHNQEFSLPLAGTHQVQNALVAIKTMKAAGVTDLEAVSGGIAQTALPGRFQVFSILGKTVIFDVGHNPDAACAFMETFDRRFPGQQACLIIGIMKDKDIAGIVEYYCKKAVSVILTRPDVDRSAATVHLKSCIPSWFRGSIDEISNVADAVDAGFAAPEKILCIAGSFYTVGEAMTKLGITPYPEA
jgi:dihydrofolate synthase / folylpolyglutamate synthase